MSFSQIRYLYHTYNLSYLINKGQCQMYWNDAWVTVACGTSLWAWAGRLALSPVLSASGLRLSTSQKTLVRLKVYFTCSHVLVAELMRHLVLHQTAWLHMIDTGRRDPCPGAGGINKNVCLRGLKRDTESKWVMAAFLLQPPSSVQTVVVLQTWGCF